MAGDVVLMIADYIPTMVISPSAAVARIADPVWTAE
jgi:hypothetical protein